MLLRRILKTTLTRSQAEPSLPWSRYYSAKAGAKSTQKPQKKSNPKKPGDESGLAAASADSDKAGIDERALRARLLAEDDKKPSLDKGPNGRPLFTSTSTLSQLTRKDTCSYFKFSKKALCGALPEGLPKGMATEFEESMRESLIVRQSFLDLRDNFKRIVDPPLDAKGIKGFKVRKQIVLDGPLSCGKSIALAMLVHWARDEGWLVFYAPRGWEWTHGGYFYKNPHTGLWDTPLQAENILKDFLKYNESKLKQLHCHMFDPIPLGEGAGVGWMKGVDSMPVPEGSTLFDLVQIGIKHTHAAVGVVVRLRKELSFVKDVPVLFAIDQYNSWFTFSEYEEPMTLHSTRPVHAKEVATVNAFRSMMHNDMMVGAFSHSTAVGKLRQDLPDVPVGARVDLPRYNVDEAATVCHYYLRQRLINPEAFSDEKWKKVYYVCNGNGKEMRSLLPLIQ
ncbi:28S ribosomal protein S29, mitochondrial [Linum perenne]